MAQRADRLDWLRKHPEVLKMTRREVFDLLKSSGLLAPSTSPVDVSIFNLMRDSGYSRRQCEKYSFASVLNNKFSG